MAKTVDEIMNRELFSLRPDDRVEDAMGYLLALGITGAPVVDSRGTPIGVVSIRDLAWLRGGPVVRDRMSAPPISVAPNSLVRDAARALAENGIHRVPVVDSDGHAIGMVSMIDVVRAMLGMPVTHPDTFPHYDTLTGLVWTDPAPLVLEQAEIAPDGPGLLVLTISGAYVAESDVWVESANNLRARVHDLLSLPQTSRSLATLLQRFPSDLSFRCARMTDGALRDEVLATIRARIESWTMPIERSVAQGPERDGSARGVGNRLT